MTRKRPKAPICQHCPDVEAVLVTGATIYPRRGDLAAKNFWLCPDCGAYTGCHGATKKALGRPANAQLRDARMKLHGRFDPIWRTAAETGGYEIDYRDGIARKIITNTARSRTYAFLAEKLGIDTKVCHIAMFDLAQCRLAWVALFNVDYPQVRKWAKDRDAATPLGQLKATGARCSNCAHRLRNPGDLKGIYCDLDSDFEGYAVTSEGACCIRHSSQTAKVVASVDASNEQAARLDAPTAEAQEAAADAYGWGT